MHGDLSVISDLVVNFGVHERMLRGDMNLMLYDDHARSRVSIRRYFSAAPPTLAHPAAAYRAGPKGTPG